MGGFGSGGHRWGHRRATVESCFRFDARQLRNFLSPPAGTHFSAVVTFRSGTQLHMRESARALFHYRAGDSFFTLQFERDGETETQKIAISSTPCRFGGKRVWLNRLIEFRKRGELTPDEEFEFQRLFEWLYGDQMRINIAAAAQEEERRQRESDAQQYKGREVVLKPQVVG